MICYRDMTFCIAPCANTECHARFTNEVIDAAHQWWGGDDAPISIADCSPGCVGFKPKEKQCES